MSNHKILIPEFEQTFGDLLSALNNMISKKHRLALRELDITSLQGIELSFIVESESVVCELLSVTPPAVLKMTLELEEKGLIYRVDNPNDKRSQLLFPTEEGRQVSREFREIIVDVDNRIFSVCTEEEKMNLINILAKVVQANR